MTQEKTQACQDRAIRNATRDSLSRWEQEINFLFNLFPFYEVETDLEGHKSPLSFYESCDTDGKSKSDKYKKINLKEFFLKREAFQPSKGQVYLAKQQEKIVDETRKDAINKNWSRLLSYSPMPLKCHNSAPIHFSLQEYTHASISLVGPFQLRIFYGCIQPCSAHYCLPHEFLPAFSASNFSDHLIFGIPHFW